MAVLILRPTSPGSGDRARRAPDGQAGSLAQDVAAARPGAAEPVPIDRAVVARARSGDPRAFRLVFERYAPPVRRFLRGLLRDAGATDEATQETFVRAYRQLGGLREEERLGPWLLGIARNVAFEQLRLRRRYQQSGPASGGGAVESADPAPSPEARLLGGESDRVLTVALEALSDERRAALLLRIDHGLGYQEIAAAMGWSIPKVKNEIHRGRLELRERLSRYLGGEG